MTHHVGLFVAYPRCACWHGSSSAGGVGSSGATLPDPVFASPWREVGWSLVAMAAVIGVGLLYSKSWLLPATSRHRPAPGRSESALIYSLVALLLVLRRRGLETAWLPTRRVGSRVGIGLAPRIARAASRLGPDWAAGLARSGRSHVSTPAHIVPVQVLLEDVSIAVLFVRCRAALGLLPTLLVVASLFAAAHLPRLLASGAGVRDFVALSGDVGVGGVGAGRAAKIAGRLVVLDGAFCFDMTQFYQVQAAA